LQGLSAKILANPNDPKPYIERAEFWTGYMMLSRARADIDRSIAIAPTGAAYVWLAKLSASTNPDTKEACAYLAQARKCSTHDLQGLLKTGETYSELRLYELAIECQSAALKLQPGDANIIDWRARNLMKAGHFREAISGASYVLSKLPPSQKLPVLKGAKEGSMQATVFELNADAHKTRGISLANLHRYTEALPDLSLALEFWPGSPELLNARAEVYRKLGKPKLAEQDLRTTTGNKDFWFKNAPFIGPE
jgi:tetratricopeptide (TPR) repeat protein